MKSEAYVSIRMIFDGVIKDSFPERIRIESSSLDIIFDRVHSSLIDAPSPGFRHAVESYLSIYSLQTVVSSHVHVRSGLLSGWEA